MPLGTIIVGSEPSVSVVLPYTPHCTRTIGVWVLTSSSDTPIEFPIYAGACRQLRSSREALLAAWRWRQKSAERPMKSSTQSSNFTAIWKIREPDIETRLALPAFRQELAVLQNRFARHPRFAAWVEQVVRNRQNR